MALPNNLLSAIREVCSEQSLDASEVIRATKELVGDDVCIDFSVWSGPGFGQETLKLDVYVLGNECLYNYSALVDTSAGSCVFLDTVGQIALARVEDERSPHVLIMSYGENSGRMFGLEDDRDKLEGIRRNIIAQSLIARKTRRLT